MNIQESFQFVKDNTVLGKLIKPYANRPSHIQDRGHLMDFGGYFYAPKTYEDDVEHGFYYANIMTYKDGRVYRSPCSLVEHGIDSEGDILANDWYIVWIAGNTIVDPPK